MLKLFCVLLPLVIIPSTRALSLSAVRQNALNAHNRYRAAHGAPALTLSGKLNAYAQQWAEKMASMNRLVHSRGPYGENIYMSWGGSAPTGTDATDTFYREVRYYSWNNPRYTDATGHFTQLVWKSSRHLGIGIARSHNGAWYLAASYDPPGNVIGQFASNVQRNRHGK